MALSWWRLHNRAIIHKWNLNTGFCNVNIIVRCRPWGVFPDCPIWAGPVLSATSRPKQQSRFFGWRTALNILSLLANSRSRWRHLFPEARSEGVKNVSWLCQVLEELFVYIQFAKRMVGNPFWGLIWDLLWKSKVQAEAGLALWWPNVRDDLSTDERTEHEAQSVHEGTKLTANLWLHEYDFRTPFTFGCNLDEVGASIQSDEL